MIEDRQSQSVTARVQALYEAFPYPHYPLWAPLRWQDGYLSSLAFSRRLLADQILSAERTHQIIPSKRTPRILLAGSGEALPYILGKFEPRHYQLTCLDISARSMRRARTRLLLTWRNKNFLAGDLNDYLSQAEHREYFDHIDSFGVLHHLPDPAHSLRLLAASLRPGGTARFMVYNSPARDWITHLQKAFRLLHLDLHLAEDRALVRSYLQTLRTIYPSMDEHLTNMGESTLRSATRLVDTFMHAHEIRWDIQRWLNEFNAAGLQPFALFDRYAELDDLPNPLWQMPSAQVLADRAVTGDYAGNLELFLHKPPHAHQAIEIFPQAIWRWWRHTLRAPPSSWRCYEETQQLDLLQLQKLWWCFLAWTYQDRDRALTIEQNPETMQRLARIGAILPGQCQHPDTYRLLKQAMQPAKTANERESASSLAKDNRELLYLVERTLTAKNLNNPRRRQAVMRRLALACGSAPDATQQ